MKKQSLKRNFTFIIVLMLFSAFTQQTIGQATKDKKPPHGGHGDYCNCLIRPIPFACGQICGFRASASETISVTSGNSASISFQSIETRNTPVKVYDATGRLVKTIANSKIQEGDRQIEWNAKDESGNVVPAGIYVLKANAENRTEIKKVLIVK